MARHHSESRQANPLRGVAGEFRGQPNRSVAFCDIEQQGCHSGRAAGGPQDVRGSDVATARFAYVCSAREFYQQKSKRDSAQQVSDDHRDESQHRQTRGNPASWVYSPPAERYKKNCVARNEPKSKPHPAGNESMAWWRRSSGTASRIRARVRCGENTRSSIGTPSWATACSVTCAKARNRSPPSIPTQKTRGRR